MASDQIIELMAPSGLLTGIEFDILTDDDIEKICHVNIVESNDVTNAKLGLPNASSRCQTCGSKNTRDCEGHVGLIKLPRTIYHPYFVTEVIQILNQICPGCMSIKGDLQMKDSFDLETWEKSIGEDHISEAFGKTIAALRRKFLKLCKSKVLFSPQSVLDHARKFYLKKSLEVGKKWAKTDAQATCKYCARNATDWYPAVKFKLLSKDMLGKKSLSVIAEVNDKLPKKFQNKSLGDVLPQDFWSFVPTFSQQQESNANRITVSPYQAFCLLKELDPEFIKQFALRRDVLFLSYLPVSPNCHRVVETSHVHADGPQLSFDQSTKAYKRLVDISRKIDEFRQHQQFVPLATSFITSRVLDCLNVSKLRARNSSNGDSSCLSGLKWLKEVVLSKRSDNVFRMTMVGDPKIKLGQIGIPFDISQNMYISEHVNTYNLEKLNMSCNLHLLTKEELHSRSKGQLTSVRKSNQLQVGDTIYRPLENDDLILVNRPPSVHQHSLIALSVKILPIQSVVSINPLCCAPLLGDFDGDCLHGYVPQSVHCRVELGELVSLDHQLLNAQDGRSLVSLSHDSLTAAHLLTNSIVFLNKFEMQQFEMLCPSQSPSPSIIKAPTTRSPLWTGQQLFSMLLPPTMDFSMGSNKIPISKGEVLSTSGASFWLQNTTSSIFSSMFKCYGRKALDFLFSAQEVLCEYLTTRGLSVSLGDVYLSSDLYSRRKMTDEVCYGLEEAEDACHIKQLMLDPEMEFLLKSHDGTCRNPYNYARNQKHISQFSIAAFRDVFYDLQNVIHQYISRDNSMLAMIHAGSKGSLSKLVQQGACLGLQLPASPLPFRIPRRLSCVSLNAQKKLEYGIPQDVVECVRGQNSYAVVKASFLDGLNPLECFVHAITGRSNMFSENAELPGMLTRKLMFYMRDLYAAYDGTVRSTYGQQLVQFSYNIPGESSSEQGDSCTMNGEKDAENNRLGGQPVGSWASCAISEAAYGALDHPMNSLEASPLLNLKKVLECGKSRASVDKSASIFLSKGLKKQRYGFEYGALEVKNHLDRVLFSDLVTTVLIFYAGLDVQGTKFSPWITHFHVSKERMMRKRLRVQTIIDQLSANYNFVRETVGTELPGLRITSKDCSLIDIQNEHDETFCIMVLVDTPESEIQLDTIRDVLVPLLLETLVKGFWEFKKVEILCDIQPDSLDELFLRVSMSEKCLPGKFWSALQNACIPIMDLIDWEHSHPNSMYDIFSIYGIDAAWKYFLRHLKSATSDTGRCIHEEHLLMAADCLSVTGEFHGLSIKGLKKQRDQASISSPFTLACLSNPGYGFINAAKQGSVDHLGGTLDAMAWGKEAPVGTGGPFEIIYSGKVHNPQKTENIYKTLLNFKVEKPWQDDNKLCRHGDRNVSTKWKHKRILSNTGASTGESIDQLISEEAHTRQGCPCEYPVNKWERQSKGHVVSSSVSSNSDAKMGFSTKSALRSAGSWANIVDMCSNLRTILHEYPINGYLNETDKSCLMEALSYHPKRDAKMGTGIQGIKIGHSPLHPGSRCFVLVRNDGTTEDFSYRKCIIGAAYSISPEFGSMVEKKMSWRR
ncbi:DNA-directed RNA polymerase IV subunit 1 isoform X1 [Phoenix dactylifera]|uniref:DNA-directed RNA polymerase subunit n=1 Tax=Phoenix dactylifera TaxID=42345 RepID=A0A8B7MVU2_PHODC|nr:DNA-directed RNA polymerase IV subunit 1 isoform X1 [Phoenix dactylifera]